MLMDIDGSVRAMVGGRDYGASQFNRATDAMRQPGSSFKPYVYATALMNGFKPTSIVVDAPICIGNWCPHNYGNGYRGSMTLIQALTHSINTIAVRLSIAVGDGNPKLGRAKIIKTAHDMGIRTPLPDTPSLPIGADEVTVLDHTGAYATFPNLGKAVTPHAILEVRTGDGELVWRFDRDGPKPRQVLPPQRRRRHDQDDEQRRRKRHRQARAPRRHRRRRQDRHHQRLSRRLVHGLHRQFRVRRLVRQRRLHVDQPHDRRLAAGDDLAQHHGLCASGHRTEAAARRGRAARCASRRRSPKSRQSRSDAPPPPRPAMLTKRGADVLVRVERMMDDANRALGRRRSPVPIRADKKKQADCPGAATAADVELEGHAFGSRN